MLLTDTVPRASIATASGGYFSFVEPIGGGFTLFDIAHALSNLCRFTGHTIPFYSVAQHSVLLSHIVPPEDAFAGLMHDAAEAFIGDVAKPLKELLPDYWRIEALVEQFVRERFGLPFELPASVKLADKVMLVTERRDLMEHSVGHWRESEGVEPLPDAIVPLAPTAARQLFLDRFHVLNAKK